MIIHADMDAFYASVEIRERPELSDKPVVVGGSAQGRGVVSAANYVARRFGIRSAMPMAQAIKRCAELVVLPVRMELYAQVSTQIQAIFHRYTPLIETLSLDEAFLDVTRCQRLMGPPAHIAELAKLMVFKASGLQCSVGVSGDKTTAKYAAKLNKPDGMTIIPPWEAEEVLRNVPVIELCGINQGIGAFLAARGVYTCGDMKQLPIGELGRRFGNPGRRIWLMAQGLDPEPVRSCLPAAKSIGHGKVLAPDTRDPAMLRTYLLHMSHRLGERLRANRLVAQQYLFGLRLYRGWLRTIERSLLPCDDEMVIYRLGERWLERGWRGQGIWQLRIVALDPRSPCQDDLFQRKHPRRVRAHRAMDGINARYGAMTLTPARLLGRSSMPDVISPAWKPGGHRKSV